jgi:hypothetical protein
MGRNLGPLNIKDSYEGLVQISGSLLTDGSGSLISNLEVTASYATTADASISASYAQTSTSASHALVADVALNVPATASYALYAEVAGYASSSLSASHALVSDLATTASYVENAVSASYALTSTSASHADNSDSSLTAISASFATTASYVESVVSASYAQTATSSSHAVSSDTAISASYAVISDTSISSSYSTFSETSVSSSHADNSDTAISASYAVTASYAENANLQQVTDVGATTNQAITLNQASGSIPLQVNSLAGGSTTLLRLSRGNAGANNFVVTAGDATNATLSMGNSVGYGNISFPASGNNEIQATTKLKINTPDLYISSSTEITGSLNVVGPIISGDGTNTVGTNGNEASIAGRNNVTTGNIAATVGGEYHDNSAFRGFIGGGEQTTLTGTNVAAMGGYNNNIGGTYGAFGGGQGNTIGGTSYFAGGLVNSNGSGYIYAMLGGERLDCQTDSTFLGGGADNTSVSGHRKGAIIGGDNNTLNGSNTDRSVIIGGTTNTIQSGSQNSVILGGQNIVSDASDTVYTPNLNISGSLTDSTGSIGTAGQVLSSDGVSKVLWTTSAGGAAFPYTGSAQITGSLGVTGSIYGILQDNEVIDLKYQATSNGTTPNIGIGYKEGGFDTTGVANILIGTGNNGASTSVNRFIAAAGYGNSIIGGSNQYISGSANSRHLNTLIGGSGNTIGKEDWNAGTISNFIGGGTSIDIFAGSYNGLIGGSSHNIYTGSLDTSPNYNGFLGGGSHDINGGDYNAFVGGSNSQITDAKQSVIVGGENHTITQTVAYADFDSVIVGGRNNNIIDHARSVVLGGDSLSSSKADEVTVPHLTISGSVTAGVYTLTDVAGTTTMDCSLGNFFTLAMPAGGSTTLTPSNIQAGQTINVKITQNATPSTIAFDASVDFEGGTAFAVSTGASEVDVMTFISFDGTTLQATFGFMGSWTKNFS